ncbi:MAG: NADP-dependent phosphogluconate dehydrogenase, partial [Myxococcota bacterium]|nr:NADP-dependent phosphogluconate dehydrogenase [Myxococcota bacterium]
HNGIEYADMQFIAEAYHVLRDVAGLTPPELAEVFTDWNQGPLESFLVEITAQIFAVRDPRTDGWLVDQVLDRAGQKGTGRWTAQVALELGVPVPSIAAAIDARVLSSMKGERQAAAQRLDGPQLWLDPDERDSLISSVHDTLLAAKVAAYAQGMALIRTASDHYGWGVQLQEMARIWKGGCIIRAHLLDPIMEAYQADPELANLMLAPAFTELLASAQQPWREVVSLALRAGVPVPGLASSLAYYDSYRAADLPQNLTQAQRDAFGAHTYQRADDPEGAPVHSDWLE